MRAGRSWRLATGLAAVVVAVVVAVLIVGGRSEDRADPEGGDVPTTPRSLAFVVSEHVDLEPTRAGVDWAADNYRRLFPHPKRAVAASTNFAGDGNIVVVGVSPEREKVGPSCDDGFCADLGDGVRLAWDELAPEEDPGLVVVVAELDTHTVVLRYSGPAITGDPRDLDLPIPVDTMVDIVTDPRVAPTTSQEAVDSGEEIDFWLDGNPVV
ncbi:hypothetical protein [Nocardioides aquiterrae]|uniref:Uncharacterized protein n=1 Tax=Nocardioides aquiterrae TaxID=203799 RepID=A0ABP4F702_9ACTN